MPSPIANHHPIAVWLDHQEARLFAVAHDSVEESTLRIGAHHIRRHSDRSAARSEHPEDAKRFFRDVARTFVFIVRMELATVDESPVTICPPPVYRH